MNFAAQTRENFAWLLGIQTRWKDNDRYGHMNNAVYYSVFENVTMTWLEVEHELDLYTGDVRCFTVENGCRYHSALRYPDKIECGVRVSRMGNSSVRYDLGIFIQDNVQVAATGFVVDVFVDSETERPVTIPQHIRQVLDPLRVFLDPLDK